MLNLLSQPARKSYHLDGCDSTLVALITMYTPCTVFGLLHGISSDKSENDRNTPLCIKRSYTLCGTTTHVVEVRCIATHYTTKRNDGIHLTTLY